MGKRIRRQTLIRVLGTVFVSVTAVMLLTFPTLGRLKPDDTTFRNWLIAFFIVLFAMLAMGSIRILRRMRPVIRFFDAIEENRKPAEEDVRGTLDVVLRYPVIGTVSAVVFTSIGSAAMVVAMIWKMGLGAREIGYFVLVAVAAMLFEVTFVYLMIKRTLRPLVALLFKEDPSIWNAEWRIRIPIRIKMLLGSICILTVMGLLMLVVNASFVHTVEEYISDPATMASVKAGLLKTSLIALLVALIVGLVIALLMADDLGWPLQRISEAAEDISHNRMRENIPWISEDETGTLASALNRMAQELLKTLREKIIKAEDLIASLNETVSTMLRSADAISEVTTRQAASASDQATGAQQASSASIQISAAARRISTHANAVQEMSSKARDAGNTGGDDLNAAVSAISSVASRFQKVKSSIQALGSHSEEIRMVVELIEEISTQINLLALNAALEAAGAGPAGRRFGVVATEVGRLAEKTYDAISRINVIIEETIAAIEVTARLARESEEAALASADVAGGLEESFKKILDLVNSTYSLASEIKDATAQQTTGSDLMVETLQGFVESASKLELDSRKLGDSVWDLIDQAERLKKLSSE